MRPALALLALGLTACLDTSVQATEVALSVAGTDASAPFGGRDGVSITLERADLAFGPLYLCGGFVAGELCDEALAEHRDAVVIDALDPSVAEVAAMPAITGTARSYMFDYGLVSLLTRDEPLVTAAAASLGGASARLEGRVEVAGQSIPFAVAVPVQQSGDVSQGVPVVRSGEADGFSHAILPDGRTRVLVRFDPRPWLASARFGDLVEDGVCAPGVEVVCAGSTEQRCDADGAVAEARDCAATGQACVVGLGCVERVELDGSHQIGRALRTALEAGERPDFDVSQR